MKKKVHKISWEQEPTESNTEYWYEIECENIPCLDDPEVTKDWKRVTCLRCLAEKKRKKG